MSAYSDDDWEAVFDREEAHEAARKRCTTSESKPGNQKLTDSGVASVPSTGKAITSIKQKPKTNLTYDPVDNIELDDPVLERQRRERLIQRTEAQLFGDLLDGCELDIPGQSTDDALGLGGSTYRGARDLAISGAPTLDSIALKNLTDCKKLVDLLSPKIESSPAKSVAWLELLTGLIGCCASKMDDKDLRTLIRKTDDLIKARDASRRQQIQSKRKVNDSVQSRIHNYKDELDMLYGGGVDPSEESDDEADDGFM